MKISYPAGIFLLILLFSCGKSDNSGKYSSCELSGNYFNRTVLDKCPNAMPWEIPYYALQLSFEGKDTVIVNNGFEKFSLTYAPSKEKCAFTVSGATLDGDMQFIISGDTLILHDTLWTRIKIPSVFTKESNPSRQNWSFDEVFNTCVVAGNYIAENKEGKKSSVAFLPNGQVSGLIPYLSYSLCYAGDCLEETEIPSNLIEFTDNQGQRILYAYTWSEDHTRLQFYKIGEPKPDIKGERTIGDLSFELQKGQLDPG